jgi:hypothetical protein
MRTAITVLPDLMSSAFCLRRFRRFAYRLSSNLNRCLVLEGQNTLPWEILTTIVLIIFDTICPKLFYANCNNGVSAIFVCECVALWSLAVQIYY